MSGFVLSLPLGTESMKHKVAGREQRRLRQAMLEYLLDTLRHQVPEVFNLDRSERKVHAQLMGELRSLIRRRK